LRSAPPVFGGGEDPHCAVWIARRDSIAELCRREGIVQNLYYRWSKEFLEVGKKAPGRRHGTAATSKQVKSLCQEASALKEMVAELGPEIGCSSLCAFLHGRGAPRSTDFGLPSRPQRFTGPVSPDRPIGFGGYFRTVRDIDPRHRELL
jgi:transposase-like protein